MVALQEDAGLAGRDRRRVPPQLVLGPVRRALRGLRHQAGGVQVPRRPRPRGRLHRDLCHGQALAHAAAGARRVRLPAQRDRRRRRKITMPAPSTMHFYRCTDFADAAVYADAETLLRRPRPHLPRGDRRSRRGRLPLHPARRGGASPCCAIRPSATRSQARARTPTGWSISISRPSTTAVAGAPPDMPSASTCAAAISAATISSEGGYESVAERFFSRHSVTHFLLEYDTARAGDFKPLRFVPKDKGVVLGLVSTQDAGAGEPRRSQAPRRGSGQVHRSRPARASARNADLPRPPPATRSPKRTSVPSSSSSSMPPRKSGIDRRPVARGRGPAGRSAAYTASAPR